MFDMREPETWNVNEWNMATKVEEKKMKKKNPVSPAKVCIYVLITLLHSWLNDLVCLKETDISVSIYVLYPGNDMKFMSLPQQ